MQELSVVLTGANGTIMNNGQTADPLNKFAKQLKALSAIRKKTDEIYEDMAKVEFLSGLYVDEDGEIVWPGENIEAMLISAAKKQREGQIAKTAVHVFDPCKLIYKGPKSPEKLWEDESFRLRVAVRVTTSKVMRTRPIFRQWSLPVTITYDEKLVDERLILQWLEIAGNQIGLGDWRPKFGRFTVAKGK